MSLVIRPLRRLDQHQRLPQFIGHYRGTGREWDMDALFEIHGGQVNTAPMLKNLELDRDANAAGLEE
jgi:hypothetical protein